MKVANRSLVPPNDSLRLRSVRGAVVVLSCQACKFVVQFVSVMAMSRLLTPMDFGVIAMVAPVSSLAMLLQGLGLNQALIQERQLSHGQVSALFWLNTALSATLTLLMAAGAPLVGFFYNSHLAAQLTAAYASIVFVSGASALHLALINRQMRFAYLSVSDAVGYCIGLGVGVVFAAATASVWAIFAGALTSSVFSFAAAWLGARWIPGAPARLREVRDLLRFGLGLTTFNIFNYITRNADNIIIGHSLGNVALGLYDRAYKILLFPLQQVVNPLNQVVYPILSRLFENPDRYRVAFLRILNQIQLAIQPGLIFAIATAHDLIPLILGRQWEGAAPIFAWLGATAVQQPFSSMLGWLLQSQARTRDIAIIGAVSAAIALSSFFAGLPWGAVGVAAAFSLSGLFLRLPISTWIATRQGPVTLGDLLSAIGPHLLGAGMAFLSIAMLGECSALGTWQRLGLSLGASYGVSCIVLAAFPAGRRTLLETGGLLRMILGSSRP